MLAGGDHFNAGNDLRSDDLYILVKTLAEGDGYTFSAAVLDDEDITVVGTDEFLHRLVRHDKGVRFAQTDGGGDVHTRAKEVLAIRDDDLTLEGMGRRIDSRIHDLHGSRESLIGVDIRREGQFHTGFEEREIGLRDSYKRFELIDLGEDEYRLTAVELAILVVFRRDDAGERGFDVGVGLKEGWPQGSPTAL